MKAFRIYRRENGVAVEIGSVYSNSFDVAREEFTKEMRIMLQKKGAYFFEQNYENIPCGYYDLSTSPMTLVLSADQIKAGSAERIVFEGITWQVEDL
jgi:hypothetical protein